MLVGLISTGMVVFIPPSLPQERGTECHFSLSPNKPLSHLNVDGSQVVMRYVPGGQFIKNPRQHSPKHLGIDVEPFYVMATPVTQSIWAEVVDHVNSKVKYGRAFNPYPSHLGWEGFLSFSGRLPVENVSFHEVLDWITNLNTLSLEGDPLVSKWIPDHKPGDSYRLLNETEWLYLMDLIAHHHQTLVRMALETNTNSETDSKNRYPHPRRPWFDDYAWYRENSPSPLTPGNPMQTQPVASKSPLMIPNPLLKMEERESDDGMPLSSTIYDFLGNVAEFATRNPEPEGKQEVSWNKELLEFLKPPPRPPLPRPLICGGAWCSPQSTLFETTPSSHDTHKRSPLVGFRLARSIR